MLFGPAVAVAVVGAGRGVTSRPVFGPAFELAIVGAGVHYRPSVALGFRPSLRSTIGFFPDAQNQNPQPTRAS